LIPYSDIEIFRCLNISVLAMVLGFSQTLMRMTTMHLSRTVNLNVA